MSFFSSRSRRAVLGVVAVWLGCLFVHADANAQQSPANDLTKKLYALCADRRLGGAKTSLIVQRCTEHAPIAARDQDALVPVASNVKLVTSAAALSLLGPEFRYRTTISAENRRGAAVVGDLYIKGMGDPTLREADLWQLASNLYDQGIRQVQGGLVTDESYFDDQRMPPLYNQRKTDAYYRSATGALSLNENVVSIKAIGGTSVGQPARLIVVPRSGYLKIDADIVTVGRRRRTFLNIKSYAEGDHTILQLNGRISVGSHSGWQRRRIEHPDLFTGVTFLEILAHRGITVDRPKVAHRHVPKTATVLATHHSPPLAVIVRTMNKTSSNLIAEQVLKTIGAEKRGTPGTWEKGLTAVRDFLGQIGFTNGSYQLMNGSGLYDANRFTPRQLAKVLCAASGDFRYGYEYVSSMAISGVDGTLGHRLDRPDVHRYVRGKTGTLAHVVSLAGFVGHPTDRNPLVFSVVISDLAWDRIIKARQVVDELVSQLAIWHRRNPLR